ncbi:protein of unknown function (DUF3987), partial [Haematococcus lacustris]
MIGEPGSGKTPTMTLVLKGLHLAQFCISTQQSIEKVEERASYISGCKTMEGMCDELASTTNKSMLLTHDEFSTLYSSAGKYAAGSSSCANDKSQMLTLASAGQLVIGTKSGGRQVLEAECYNLCITSGCQPSVFRNLMVNPANIADGTLYRYIPLYGTANHCPD